MDEQMKKHGAISWSELMTTDIAAAKTFYGKLFGWELEQAPMEGMEYTIAKVGGKQVAGMMAIPEQAQGAPPAWGLYVTVDDVDATAEKATQLGAQLLVPPKDIPEVGRFCVIQDPQGACISAISYIEQ